jgi:hypothetical protein
MAHDYPQQIARLDDNGLFQLWQQVRDGTVDQAQWESGKAFEYLILQAFAREGAEVIWPYDVRLSGENVEQIDGAIYCNGVPPCLVEAKDYAENVNIEPIAKMRNQLLRRPGGTIGVCFSKTGFTDPAKTLASFTMPQAILLWNGDELEMALQDKRMCEGLRAKYRYAVEHGLPEFDLRERLL